MIILQNCKLCIISNIMWEFKIQRDVILKVKFWKEKLESNLESGIM